MKRILVMIILISSVALYTFANGSQETAAKAATSYDFQFWFAGTDGIETEYWQTFFEDFFADKDDMTFSITGVPWSDFATKLNVAFASGTAPDLVHYPIASISQRASMGQFMPLDKYYNNWDGKEDYLENLYNLGEYQGQLYGLVTFTDPRVLVWRKDLFEESGLDPEVPPANWKELEEYALKLTKKQNGQTVRGGFQIPFQNSNQMVQIFALQNGGSLIDDKGTTPTFDSIEVMEAAEYLQNLVQAGVSLPWDQLTGDQFNPFPQGKVAMSYDSPQAYRNLLKNHPELEGKIGVRAPLSNTDEGTFCGARLLYISSETERPDLAWDVIEKAMSTEEALKRYELFFAPVNRTSLLEDYIADDPELNTATIAAIQVGEGIAKVPWFSLLNRSVSNAMERAFYGEDVRIVFPEEAEKLRDELKDFQSN
ncbi:MAG: ABC transporter substrate-binding protein [Spirochaetales bacterium]|nr:ABC transporter substrate-binding protein [Spirochaetales bacterium]